MIVMGLDTTGPHCSVSIVNDAQVLAHISEKIGRGHAEALAPMVKRALNDAGLNAADITKLAVCTGPGSFTGLRVALSFAKGFALPRKMPVIGINALEVMAAQIDPHQENRVVSVMDVRRGELCWAGYEKHNCLSAPVTEPVETARKNIAAFAYDRLAGDGADQIAEASPVLSVSTAALAWLAMDKDVAVYPAIPLYSRGPDAKLPGGKSL